MKPIPLTPDTAAVARRVVWFEEPAEAFSNPIRFMAHAMAFATHTDMNVLRRYLSDEDFLEALDKAPPGIIDPRSWAYWNSRMGRYPAPPPPRRAFRQTRLSIEPPLLWTVPAVGPLPECFSRADAQDQRRQSRHPRAHALDPKAGIHTQKIVITRRVRDEMPDEPR